MGYSCTAAAANTLQAIKEVFGADLEPSNEVRLQGRLQFFERDEEQIDGAIIGRLFDLRGALNPRKFRINADGTIAAFPGVPKRLWPRIVSVAAIRRHGMHVAVL